MSFDLPGATLESSDFRLFLSVVLAALTVVVAFTSAASKRLFPAESGDSRSKY